MIKRLLLPILLLLPVITAAAGVPPLTGHVNDHASLLSAEGKIRLEETLAAFETRESTQIVVLTVPSLEGDPIEDYSIRVAEAWKIGMKGKDNGVILIIAREEKKIRMEVGRGLEGKLTDLTAGRIIRGEMTPRFKAGDMQGGIFAGVDAVMKTVTGEYRPDSRDLRQAKKSGPPLLTLLLFFCFACVFLGAFSRFLGGAAGAFGLPVIGKLLFPGLAPLIMAGLGIVGFLVGLFLAFLFGSGGGFGGGRGGGGYYGGPFFGGGGFRSGGGDSFSGGGGDFGGGGASGDW